MGKSGWGDGDSQIAVTRLAVLCVEALRLELSDRLALHAAMKLDGELA
jgi:hypothetical protein